MIRTKRLAEEVGLAGVLAVATGAVLATRVQTPGGLVFAAVACVSGMAMIAAAVGWLKRPHTARSRQQGSQRMPDELNAF